MQMRMAVNRIFFCLTYKFIYPKIAQKSGIKMTIKASCHCGKVKFELNDEPKWLTECNCSICSKIGALWAHSDIENITISMPEDGTIRYIWGDKGIAFHSCKNCGNSTHWENLGKGDDLHMAVNMRMLDPKDIANIKIRHFDGADSWEFLD